MSAGRTVPSLFPKGALTPRQMPHHPYPGMSAQVSEWWGGWDSNPGPADMSPPADSSLPSGTVLTRASVLPRSVVNGRELQPELQPRHGGRARA